MSNQINIKNGSKLKITPIHDSGEDLTKENGNIFYVNGIYDNNANIFSIKSNTMFNISEFPKSKYKIKILNDFNLRKFIKHYDKNKYLRLEKDIRYGLLSDIPGCCIAFYIHMEINNSHMTEQMMDYKTSDSETDCNYVRCPSCRLNNKIAPLNHVLINHNSFEQDVIRRYKEI